MYNNQTDVFRDWLLYIKTSCWFFYITLLTPPPPPPGGWGWHNCSPCHTWRGQGSLWAAKPEMCGPWENWRRDVQVNFRQLQNNKSFVRILLIEILCRLGCATGILESVYSRNQFSPTLTSFLKPEEVNMARVVPLRTAAKEESMGGGQGVPKCNCTGNCLNARCSCKKESRRCNSRCHNKRSCANVDAFIGWNKP